MILRVALPTPLRRVFDYTLPGHLEHNNLRPGSRVRVPFGSNQIIGVFLERVTQSDVPPAKLKSIIEIIDHEPLFPATLLQLCRWAADYYQHSIGEVLFHAMPLLLRRGIKAELKKETFWGITLAGKQAVEAPSLFKRSKKSLAFLTYLLKMDSCVLACALKKENFSRALIDSCEKKGWVEPTFAAKVSRTLSGPIEARPIKLNSAQEAAVEAILKASNQFQSFLLDGVTGSGKTEVYLSAIEKVIANGKQAMVLIPEIALTPQAIARFQQRFTVPIVCLHSGLNETERLNAWLLVKQNRAKIIIGTRSAVFSPSAELGIIIIDEEHDPSFKQQESFRYSARDLAMIRAKFENIPIVLGSATPSLETMYNTKTKNIIPLHLPERTGKAIHPTYHFINTCNQSLTHGLSTKLLERIEFHLSENNQALLFLNRRGYAPVLMCHYCGWVADCHRCDTHLTLHKNPPALRCHHCDSIKAIPRACPQCQHEKLREIGTGTERLEMALTEHFPEVPIFRIDRDTMRRKDALHHLLEQVQNGHRQILIGTQMVAKGHHFPNVTLVGIINADAGFFSSDFRSIERAGQLLVQVAGRAGRAEKPGEVWIQTFHPDHPLLRQLTEHGYQSFAKFLLHERKDSLLPPYSHLALLRAESLHATASEDFLNGVKEIATPLKSESIMILGPIPSPILKQKNYFRAQLLFQSSSRSALQTFLKKLILELERSKLARKVKWSIDIDPIEMI